MIDFLDMELNMKEPVYIQIVNYVKRQIFLKKVVSGDILPSRRELAAQLRINPNTAQKAFRVMEEEGYILTPKNAASTIYCDAKIFQKIKEEMTRGMAIEFIQKAKENQLSFHAVITLIKEEWDS